MDGTQKWDAISTLKVGLHIKNARQEISNPFGLEQRSAFFLLPVRKFWALKIIDHSQKFNHHVKSWWSCISVRFRPRSWPGSVETAACGSPQILQNLKAHKNSRYRKLCDEPNMSANVGKNSHRCFSFGKIPVVEFCVSPCSHSEAYILFCCFNAEISQFHDKLSLLIT